MARGACRLRCPGTAGTSARFTDMKRHISYSADDARREIVDAMKRADDLGRAIAAQIADAERELEEIKRSRFAAAPANARASRPIQS